MKNRVGYLLKRGWVAAIALSLFTSPLTSVSAASNVAVSGINMVPSSQADIMGVFDPSHNYLEDGYSTINDLGEGEVHMSASTTGKSYVDSLGGEMILQQWTGTMWVDVYSSPSNTESDVRTLRFTASTTVDTGYYYRIISIHWAEHDGVYEEGRRIGEQMLID